MSCLILADCIKDIIKEVHNSRAAKYHGLEHKIVTGILKARGRPQ